MTISRSDLATEIDKLIVSLGAVPPSPAARELEKEIAFLVWRLRMFRMTPMESAIHYNGSAREYWINGPRPVYTLQSRIEDLIEEMRTWLSALRM